MNKKTTFKVDRIFKVRGGKTLKGFANIIINDVLMIKGVKIINKNDKYIISLPSEQCKDNKWYSIIKILDKTTGKELEDSILKEFNEGEGAKL